MSRTPRHSHPPSSLGTPVRLKTDGDSCWPEDDELFYLVAREGLFICRNNELFRSCVRAERGPSELASQKELLRPHFPRIPADVIESAVGFFSRVAERQSSEAAAFLVWDRSQLRVRLLVPEQTATIGRGWQGDPYPIGVHYTPPADLPADWVVFGDIHSHVNMSATVSSTDVADEVHSAGLHIVVGRLQYEPPDIHIEAVVDGARFRLDRNDVIEDYRNRSLGVPQEWVDRVEIEEVPSYGSVVPVATGRHGDA